jgi:uncharacterized RDD family membrane protein YckC
MQEDLLEDFYDQQILIPATKWQRMWNLFLDTFFGILFFYSFLIILYQIPGGKEMFSYEPAPGVHAISFFGMLLMIIPFFSYFMLLETFNKGRTIGKMITGTYVIKKDGTPVTFSVAFLRTFLRMIPFEAFSGIRGECWHDEWSDTIVVRK